MYLLTVETRVYQSTLSTVEYGRREVSFVGTSYKPKLLEANKLIPGLSNKTVGDFWSWAYSDILNNRNRGIFAKRFGRTDRGNAQNSFPEGIYWAVKLRIYSTLACRVFIFH